MIAVTFSLKIGNHNPMTTTIYADNINSDICCLEPNQVIEVNKLGEWWTGSAKVVGKETLMDLDCNIEQIDFKLEWMHVINEYDVDELVI